MVFQPHTTSCPEVGCDANLQRDLSFGQQMNQFRIVSGSQRMPQTLGSDIQGASDADADDAWVLAAHFGSFAEDARRGFHSEMPNSVEYPIQSDTELFFSLLAGSFHPGK